MRETVTTLGEIGGAILLITGIFLQFGAPIGLIAAGVLTIAYSWLAA